MSGFEITYARVADITADMEQATTDVQNALDALSTEMAAVRADLDGATASSYDQAMINWQKNVDDMRFLLGKAKEALQHVANNYNETDLREGALWEALQ
ncbi:WXG100 family type VII secretion target [Streptomonospora nanhaiensis]|uniref:ESAT-6-like protein n=1 Tax=Streptomonospora nanhaiensis TaxID=1323731 RepID=A0A853BUY8_9ACTN|nr:WXG100 family type VII secretion target [Streptomonospora nanhaiensis]MBV2363580.1 WXG100 family type VII secretion target [Streptomonospora nanhaiensis]MBX9391519.1 WXG100 family type VII secretion target [Streptomonospora nanhaiensis]NYI98596.1 WXG100 family type VII secretion target [Streptomonospora nanhaiensis]